LHNPTLANSKTTDGTGTGSFTSNLTGLLPGLTYYVKAYATNSIGTSYGIQEKVTIQANLPTVATSNATEIGSNYMYVGGVITSDGGSDISARGVCWNTLPNPTTANFKSASATGSGTFTCFIYGSFPGLDPVTTYYLKAYATNSIGTAYGNQLTVTTLAASPILITTSPSAITSTSAVSGGTISKDGGATITARGVCWNTAESPTIANTKTTDGTGTGSFTSNMTSLLPGTTYYVKAYATNSAGTSYGSQVTVVTPAVAPEVSTTSLSSITSWSATSGGNVTNAGGSTVTARGVCWSSTQNPTTANSKTSDGTGTGTFTSSITGLLPGSTYYVKAYATNAIGTTYGSQLTLNTPKTTPTLTTTSPTNITNNSASSGGNITNDGGALVTERGICWSTSQNPTKSNSKNPNGTGTGSFTSSLSGLTSGTTYYVRAYATNSMGTGYGDQLAFLSQGPVSGTITDVDGNIYHAVAIGTQIWMVENLKTTHYRNGDLINNLANGTSWAAATSGAYCWYNNNFATFKADYGALYNGYVVSDPRNIAPTGWHVPTNMEWYTLINFVGGLLYAGDNLKEAGSAHWQLPITFCTNSYGFTALPSGYRDEISSSPFLWITSEGYWWTSSSFNAEASYCYHISSGTTEIVSVILPVQMGVSIRCIKD